MEMGTSDDGLLNLCTVIFFPSSLKEKAVSQHVPTLSPELKDLLTVAEVASGKDRRNHRDYKRKSLPLPEVLSSYCSAEKGLLQQLILTDLSSSTD